MARASWTLDLPEASRRIDVTHGYWLGKATVRVDGRTVLEARPLFHMAYDRGVDLSLVIDGHDLTVMIRPDFRGPMIVRGYHFGLKVDGRVAPGTTPIPPIIRSASLGPTLVEGMAWATGGGAVIGLSQRGLNPIAVAYLLAPAACSLIVRRSGLSTAWLALACAGVLVTGIVVVAMLGAVLRR